MADTVGEQIRKAMVLALNTPAAKPATCYDNRRDAFAVGELPAFDLYSVEEKAVRQTDTITERRRRMRLECLVAGLPPQDQAADPLISYAVQTLFSDSTLAGMSFYLDQTEILWQTEPGEEEACIALLDFEVAFTTLAQDPTARVT